LVRFFARDDRNLLEARAGRQIERKQRWMVRQKRRERKDDPLLRYLHHARNSDEHGIERVAERSGNERDLQTGEKLKFNERREKLIVSVQDRGTGEIKHRNLKAYLYGPSLQMVRVHDRRYGESF
jgi:hypothetical protein